MPYVNLPGSYVELQDGNLSFFTRNTGQSVLVMGTATKGLTAEPYLMTDLASAVKEFGATSELTRAASEVRKGGALNIYLYRLPGEAPLLEKVGAEFNGSVDSAGAPALGFTILPTQASPEAGANYGLAYRHAKHLGSAGQAADAAVVIGELLVVNLDTNAVVWAGNSVVGSTYDSGEVDVSIDTNNVAVGTDSEPEVLTLTLGATDYTYGSAAVPLQTTRYFLGVASAIRSGLGNQAGTGSGATFDVAIKGSPTSYSSAGVTVALSVSGAGGNYAAGDTIKVLGSLLGGVNVINDLHLTVSSVTGGGATGAIATFAVDSVGQKVPVAGATFTVTVPAFSTTSLDYETDVDVALVSGGVGYTDEEIIFIKGSDLGGFDGPDGDVTYEDVASTPVSPLSDGLGATFTIVYPNGSLTGSYSGAGVTVDIEDAGTGYTVGEVVRVSGALLGGDATNDLLITVGNISAAVGFEGAITGIASVSGTHAATGYNDMAITIKSLSLGDSVGTDFEVAGVGAQRKQSVVVAMPISGHTHTAILANVVSTSDLATKLAASLDAGEYPFDIDSSSSTVTISGAGVTGADGELVYPALHTLAGYSARPYLSGTPVFTLDGGVTVSSSIAFQKSFDLGVFPQDINKPFAPASGGVYVPLRDVLTGGTFRSYGLYGRSYTHPGVATLKGLNSVAPTLVASYAAGNDGASISLMKRYERLHTSFEDLDLAAFDFVLPVGVALDSPNLSDTNTVVGLTANTYPTPKTSKDVLGYCAIVNNGDYTYTYYWADADGLLAKIASNGESVSSVDSTSLAFAEVNFAHLLAKYCYENSTDYKFTHGVIGTSAPASGVSPRAIRSYMGMAPTYAWDQENAYWFIESDAQDGTGLLGHKFVGGKAAFNDGIKHGGFFLTADGTLDYSASNMLYDENAKKIDLGKYISVVGIFGRTNDDVNPRGPSYVTNVATVVAGMLPGLAVGDSLINVAVPNVAVDYRIETKTVDMACGLGLVVAKTEGGQAFIADSPTFASPTSDYTRLTTVRIVSSIAEQLRTQTKPYIGKGLSAPKRAALEAAIGEVLKANLGGEAGNTQIITNASFKIEQSAQDRVLGKMRVNLTITPVFELRQITFSVNLSAQ